MGRRIAQSSSLQLPVLLLVSFILKNLQKAAVVGGSRYRKTYDGRFSWMLIAFVNKMYQERLSKSLQRTNTSILLSFTELPKHPQNDQWIC